MAEILGVIASVLTVTDAVAQVVRFAVDLYKAPIELVALQRELANIRGLVQGAEDASKVQRIPQMLQNELVRAREIMAELHKVITEKLVSSKTSAGDLRRISWMKCKPEVARLRKRLKEAREAVLAAVSVEQLATLRRTEGTMQIFLNACVKHESSIHTGRPLLRITNQVDSSRPAANFKEMTLAESLSCESLDENIKRFVDDMEPMSLLEASPSFRPEIYTVDVSFRQIVPCAPCALETNEFVRVSEYTVFYHAQPRRWVTMTVTVATGLNSKLWDLVPRSTLPESSDAEIHCLAPSVNAALQTALSRHRLVRHGSHFSIFVGATTHPHVQQSKRLFDHRSYLQDVTLVTQHWRVARYPELALDRKPLAWNSYRFAAWLGSRWVESTAFRTQKFIIDAQFYTLKVAHALQFSKRHSQLLGLVVDDSGTVSGFLREFPLHGSLYRYLRKLDQTLKLERLWSWCEQLVRAVAEAHDAGFVIGTLASYHAGSISLDGDHKVVLRCYTEWLERRRQEPGRIPPEYDYLSTVTTQIRASAESDLYQLGLELWFLATGVHNTEASTFCRLTGCSTTNLYNCEEPHANPIQLPWPVNYVPHYIKAAVAICRSEQPAARWPAWKLLSLFPTYDAKTVSKEYLDVKDADDLPSSPGLQRLEDYPGSIGLLCDWCSQVAIKHNFHCNVCFSSNFDVCPECFLVHGKHCLDSTHYLQERQMGCEVGHGYGHFYSSVKPDGKRDIIEG